MIAVTDIEVLVDGLDHPEGVAVDADGRLYAGGEAGQVYRIDVERGTAEEVASTGGFLLGLCADAEGRLYCCDIARKEVVRVDPRTGDVSTYSAGAPSSALVNPNWPVFDAAGNLFVTDSGSWKGGDGCIMRVRPGGTTDVWTEQTKGFPNGACLTADGRALLVLESNTPALVRVPIEDDGSAGSRELVAMLDGTVPDGICLDEDGVAYVFCYRPDRVLTVGTDGEVSVLADDPEGTALGAPTNGVWIGANRTELVCGNLGRWHLSRMRPGVRGVALEYPSLGPS